MSVNVIKNSELYSMVIYFSFIVVKHTRRWAKHLYAGAYSVVALQVVVYSPFVLACFLSLSAVLSLFNPTTSHTIHSSTSSRSKMAPLSRSRLWKQSSICGLSRTTMDKWDFGVCLLGFGCGHAISGSGDLLVKSFGDYLFGCSREMKGSVL